MFLCSFIFPYVFFKFYDLQRLMLQGPRGQNNQSLLQSRMMNMNNIPAGGYKGGMGDIFTMPVGSLGKLQTYLKSSGGFFFFFSNLTFILYAQTL